MAGLNPVHYMLHNVNCFFFNQKLRPEKCSCNTMITFLFARGFKMHQGVDESEVKMAQELKSLTVNKWYH